MLILDVKSRWSSTHQMMSRALKYRTAINEFIANNRDLRSVELTMQDWDAITMVTDWLLNLRAATTEMSATSRPMLSSTHSIFRGLQKTLTTKLAALPEDSPPEFIEGLTKAHRKLTDYYYKFDQFPFYIWAARNSCRHTVNQAKIKPFKPFKSLCLPFTDLSKLNLNKNGFNRLKRFIYGNGWSLKFVSGRRLSEFGIPQIRALGSAVAVERVFSGGRDTISLRCSRLKPETIRTLMVLKHHLRLRRKSAEDALRAIVIE
ncbi:ribonuclease H-like domain-containing protein [Mycena pura]|uniref:Ribonuclease H-like domain-containing protein n=1 Tax=Mycena pura TaxID=153505 RepID=A0AAD6UKU9_9AGAR|nr:ribonuclease H-like domain-containing protein [Mycena pura]